tara:strand:- start:52150 stop:52602 length:453 start_codon:yes stop_codon:yes gene_type:complete
MTTVNRLSGYIFDSLLELEDGAAPITASGQGSGIIDLGDAHVTGEIVLDVSAIDTVTGDELYDVLVELSDSATFASGVEQAASIQLGGTTGAAGARDVTSDAGRYAVPFQNQLNTRQYRYVRLNLVIGGTSTSITFVGYISKTKASVGAN